jgi:hypothetical protein
MKVCPNCQTKYPDDANFCPQEGCATAQGPRRLDPVVEAPASRYRLESQLGGARSGEVWQAVDTQTGSLVVYKRVASASLPTSASLERAQRELKQLQRAQSPRLARVLDFGKEADGRLFVVTELCEGQPLDRLVAATGAMPLDRVKKIVAQIGEALLEGQKVGVVHHDLAAKNVLVMDGDTVKVINFVAAVAATETVFGVPEYLSPEQAEGKLVDQRSNTYSLGAIMTLMLSGQAPVSGSDTASVLEQVAKGTVVPPSQLVAGVSPEMDRVILKAMDKSPNRRPLTMRQFLSEVSGLVGAGAANDPNRAVGLAKTMMFTGGPPELQKLASQASAARDANGAPAAAPAAAPAPADPGPTPPPTASPPVGPRRTHGAAVAATMVALPAVGSKMPGAAPSPAQSLDAGMAPTPPPVAVTPEPPASAGPAPAAAPKPAAGGNFRETLWFKKGDVDQMVAEARARVEASRNKEDAPAEVEVPAEDARPLEDRYVDDGSVTSDDRKKFSLRSGGTATALPAVGNVPGERMSDSELASEIGGRKRLPVVAISVAVVLALIVAAVVGLRSRSAHKGAAEPATQEPATAEPAAPPPPPPAEPAAPPTPTEEAAPEAAPAKAAEKTADKGADEARVAAPAAKPKASAKRHVAAKKPKGKKHK